LYKQQVSFSSAPPPYKLKVHVSTLKQLRTVNVRETGTVEYVINKCGEHFQHYFASNCLKVFKDGVDLATLHLQSTLADLDINEDALLRVEADTSNNNITSGALSFTVKDLIGRQIPITNAYSHW
jgi:hypothetical protein